MTECEFAINGLCQISTEMAGIPVPLHDGACRACLSLPDAKLPGSHVVTDRSCWVLLQAGHAERAFALRLATKPIAKSAARRSNVADDEKEQRRKRVVEATRRKKQLIAWLQLLQSAEDAGVGDTTKRLLAQTKKQKPWAPTDARDALECLHRQCGCSRMNAVKWLNKQYPYKP